MSFIPCLKLRFWPKRIVLGSWKIMKEELREGGTEKVLEVKQSFMAKVLGRPVRIPKSFLMEELEADN